MSVQLVGATELTGALRSAADQLQRLDLDAAGRALVAAVRPPMRTGAYAATIAADTGTPARVGLSAGGGAVDYAHIIEFGSRWVPARHPLMRALESAETEVVAAAGTDVQTVLDQI